MAFRRAWTHRQKEIVCLQACDPRNSVEQVLTRYNITAGMLRRWLRLHGPVEFGTLESTAAADANIQYAADKTVIVSIKDRCQITLKCPTHLRELVPVLQAVLV